MLLYCNFLFYSFILSFYLYFNIYKDYFQVLTSNYTYIFILSLTIHKINKGIQYASLLTKKWAEKSTHPNT